MSWKTRRTGAELLAASHKVLMCANPGWGKTHQAVHMAERYGKGFILSGEAGLRSLGHSEIEYLPFTSWNGEHNTELGICSFRGIVLDMMSDTSGFQDEGYKWIMIDSITEVGERLMSHLEEKHKDNKNKFEKWGEYASAMLGVMKLIRDLDMHVVMTCLLRHEEDEDGTTHYWPNVPGKAVGKQLCGMFDHVFAGHRVTQEMPDAPSQVRRFIITDETKGYHGKSRDPFRHLSPVMETGDITELLEMISKTPTKAKGTAK